MCDRSGPISRWCEGHRTRYYSYEHVGPRPVVIKLRWTYKGERIAVMAKLRMSGGKARLREPWTTAFCLNGKWHLGGSGVGSLVSDIVVKEIKRLGWGWARGVRCQS